jgi:uncharacterized SAM-binding protein YcdF (DUF218 family)
MEFLVILGHRLDSDNKPSPVLIERLQKASELYLSSLGQAEAETKHLPYMGIIVTGGITHPKQTPSEAECMKQWLMLHGICEQDILCESRARHTLENLINITMLVRERFGRRRHTDLLAVTHDWHAPRVANYWHRSRTLNRQGFTFSTLAMPTRLPLKDRVAQGMMNALSWVDPDRRSGAIIDYRKPKLAAA